VSKKISQIVLAKKTGDYVDLPARLGSHWRLLSVHEGTRIGLGLAGVSPAGWINTVSSLFGARAGLVAAWTSLARMLHWLMGVMNPDPETELVWPDFSLLLDVARRVPPDLFAAKPEYMKTLIEKLEAVVISTGDLFRTSDGLDLNRDIIARHQSLVLDISQIDPPWVRLFLVDLLFSQVLYYRMQNYMRTDRTACAMILDESDPDISRVAEEAYADGNSPVSQCLTLGREYGILVILGARIMGQISPYVLNSMQYHCIFGVSDALAAAEAKQTLMLPYRAEQMLPGMAPGCCLFRASECEWSHAMLARVDKLDPYRGPRPEFESLQARPCPGLEQLPHVNKALNHLIAQYKAKKMQQSKAKAKGLSPNAEQLLKFAVRYPWLPVVRLFDRFAKPVTPGKQSQACKELADHGFCIFQEVRIGKTRVKLVEVKSEGYRHLDQPEPKRAGRGKLPHRTVAHWIYQWASAQGCMAQVEFPVVGTSHHADAGLQLANGKWHAFEVVDTCDSNIVDAVRASLLESTAVETVTIVAFQKRLLDKLRRMIEAETVLGDVLERVQYETAEAFMPRE